MAELVPHYDLRTLAVGCLYLLTNKGTLHFPGSSRAAPSDWVVVAIATKSWFKESDRVYFPFKISSSVWHDAIVPVLENKDVQVIVTDNPSLRVHPNLTLLDLELYDELVRKIEDYLRVSLVAHGYLPCVFAPEVGVCLDEETPSTCPPAPTEIDPNPNAPVGPDVEDLFWPDGSPKLTYKVVDDE